ncbi:MAG TPA: hypothetical protein DDW65_11815 [Firmicutes bacterium]|nr:hypothetical protein [Bacillota bacterium]
MVDGEAKLHNSHNMYLQPDDIGLGGGHCRLGLSWCLLEGGNSLPDVRISKREQANKKILNHCQDLIF